MTNDTILTEKLRVQKLKEIKDNDKPIMTGVRIPYKGQDRDFKVYRIPLKSLVYNPYNGRIGTKVKTFEVNNHKLNPEDIEDVKVIERYLWESKIDRNKKTMDSLIKYKQKEYGIVSRNGYIIDGNRRASLLNNIYRSRNSRYKNTDVTHCEFFNAIILDDDADKKEILRLETTYQMGMDEKLDYNATEKYLKCNQLLEEGYTIKDIAEMMDEKESNIKKYLEILKLMDDYLEYYDYKDMYSLLEKREGQFVDLSRYNKNYDEKSGNAQTNWDPDETDISEMLSICFDYIRAQYEGKDFRNIAQTSRGAIPKSFFANKNIWEDFKRNHENFIDNVEEDPVSTYTNTNGGDKDISTILSQRDEEWTEKVSSAMKANLNKSKRRLEDTQEADKPAVLLKNINDTLDLIDTNQETFYTNEVFNLLNQINKVCWEFKKTVQKGIKSNE